MAPHEEREKSRASPGRSITISGPCYLDLVLDCQQCCWHVAEVPTELGTKNMLLVFAAGLEVGDGGSNVLLPKCFGGGVRFNNIPKLRFQKPFYSKPPTSTIHRLD